jgi:hypothetical protein
MKPIPCIFAIASFLAPYVAAADVYVSTTGSDSNDGLSEAKAFSTLTKAQQAVRAQISSMNANITVRIAPGTYELTAPLVLTAQDSGKNGFKVNWVGAGATVSGGRKLTGWTAGTNGVYSASVPQGTKSRNLYVNGQASNYARRKIANRKDLTYTASSIKWSSGTYDWITSTSGIEQAEVRFINSFTDRYAPIQGKGNRELIMKQDSWFNNNWGYDHVAKPNADFGVWVQNALALLTEGGQFYLDSKAGKVYYKPLSGENMATVDAHLGVLETLVAVGGTYDAPAHDITFQDLSFVSVVTSGSRPLAYNFSGTQHMARSVLSRLCRSTDRWLHLREHNLHTLELRVCTSTLVSDAVRRPDQRSQQHLLHWWNLHATRRGWRRHR